MNHQEHELHGNEKACCGTGCCDEGTITKGSKGVFGILQWVLIGGAFLFSLLTLLSLPKIIRKEIVAEQAMKAGGIENYMKLNNEIYDSPEYKERMKQEVEMFIQQSKAQMEMMKNQGANPESGAIDPAAMMLQEGETPAEQAPAPTVEVVK